MLDKIKARDLLHYTADQLRDKLPEKFVLVCDDGEIETTRYRTVFTCFFWEYHRQFPELLSRPHKRWNMRWAVSLIRPTPT